MLGCGAGFHNIYIWTPHLRQLTQNCSNYTQLKRRIPKSETALNPGSRYRDQKSDNAWW